MLATTVNRRITHRSSTRHFQITRTWQAPTAISSGRRSRLGDELRGVRKPSEGSPSAITRLQYAPQRYYQRPDAPHLRFDPNATSLSGFSAASVSTATADSSS